MDIVLVSIATLFIATIAATYALLVAYVMLPQATMLDYGTQVTVFWTLTAVVSALLASYFITIARGAFLLNKIRNKLWLILLVVAAILFALTMSTSLTKVSASRDVEVVGHWQRYDTGARCRHDSCSACALHPVLRDVETNEILEVEMPQNLSDRDNFYPYQLCEPQRVKSSTRRSQSQSRSRELESFKVARVTWEETITGRRTVLSIANAAAIDKEAERNELPKPKAVGRSYVDATLDRIRSLGLSKVELIGVALMGLGGLLMLACPFLRLWGTTFAGFLLLLVGISLYSWLGAAMVLGFCGPIGCIWAKITYYEKKYPVFANEPVKFIPYARNTSLNHSFYITPLRGAFFIGIKYWCEIDESTMSRTTEWKDSFSTYQEAETELTRRYDAWQVSGSFAPD
jgi:hypothetical protein